MIHFNGGVSFFGLLTILFIGLKLGGVISWYWLWVLSPMWMPIGSLLLILFLCIIYLEFSND